MDTHRTSETSSQSHLKTKGLRLGGAYVVLMLVVLPFLATACSKTASPAWTEESVRANFLERLRDEVTRNDFEAEVKRFSGGSRFDYFILERPAYDGETVMKIAVLYRTRSGDGDATLLPPVGIVPGFTAGGFLYLQYARDLVDQGYIVLLPDVKGDYIHFIGLELFVDPLVDPNFGAFRENAEALEVELCDYMGMDTMGPEEVFKYYKALYEGEIDDQALADLYRKYLFAYRGYSLDVLVNAMYDVNEDPDSPVFGRINTDRIGLEAHSLGPDEVVEAIVKDGGAQAYWWSDYIQVALLKGAVPTLQGVGNFQAIDTPVFFMVGEYDNADGVIEPTWLRFNALQAPAGYITIYGSGHMLFIDPPVGFLGDKLLPFFGNFEGVTLPTFRRNRAVMTDLSVLIYDAYLKQDPEALETLAEGALGFAGEYFVRNM